MWTNFDPHLCRYVAKRSQWVNSKLVLVCFCSLTCLHKSVASILTKYLLYKYASIVLLFVFANCRDAIQLQLNTLRPRQNGRHFADDIFKWIFLNENLWIPIKIVLKYVPQGPMNNIPALVQIMAWRRPGDKPLSGPMMVRLPTHICVTRPQWVKTSYTKKKSRTLSVDISAN